MLLRKQIYEQQNKIKKKKKTHRTLKIGMSALLLSTVPANKKGKMAKYEQPHTSLCRL